MKKVLGPTVTLVDAATNSDKNIPFANPVHVDRLRPYDLADLEEPISGRPLKIEKITPNGRSWIGTLISQTATGAVRVKWSHQKEEDLIRLEDEEFKWVMPTS